MNDGELSTEVQAGIQPPILAATLDGGIELTATAVVSLRRMQRQGSPTPPPHGDSLVEVQALPSPLQFGAKLLSRSLVGQLLGQRVDPPERDFSLNVLLTWRLTSQELAAFESLRSGLPAEFDAIIKLAIRRQGSATTADFPVKYRIAASDWVDWLGRAGIGRALHLDLPLGSTTDVSTNVHLRDEVSRAMRLLAVGDYSGCVAVIRDLWDPIVKELSPDGRWDSILRATLPPEIQALTDAYAKSLRAIVNKAHHRGVAAPPGQPPLYEFTRRDAEFMVEAALTFLRYLGRLAQDAKVP